MGPSAVVSQARLTWPQPMQVWVGGDQHAAQSGLPSGSLMVGRRTRPHWPHDSTTSGSVL
jgi:hypothetical protein